MSEQYILQEENVTLFTERLEFGSERLLLSAITGCSSTKEQRALGCPFVLLILAGCAVAGTIPPLLEKGALDFLSIAFLAVAFLCVVTALAAIKRATPSYALRVQTGKGNFVVIISSNKDKVERLHTALREAVCRQARSVA